jgi:hypothetical protein
MVIRRLIWYVDPRTIVVEDDLVGLANRKYRNTYTGRGTAKSGIERSPRSHSKQMDTTVWDRPLQLEVGEPLRPLSEGERG